MIIAYTITLRKDNRNYPIRQITTMFITLEADYFTKFVEIDSLGTYKGWNNSYSYMVVLM